MSAPLIPPGRHKNGEGYAYVRSSIHANEWNHDRRNDNQPDCENIDEVIAAAASNGEIVGAYPEGQQGEHRRGSDPRAAENVKYYVASAKPRSIPQWVPVIGGWFIDIPSKEYVADRSGSIVKNSNLGTYNYGNHWATTHLYRDLIPHWALGTKAAPGGY